MHGIKLLPGEILANIVSHLSDTEDLSNCIQASRDLGEAAKTALYFEIDLNLKDDDEPEEEGSEVERQQRLLRAIAQNPQLGSLVRKFTNCRWRHGYGLKDATLSSNTDETEMLIGAARNLKGLTEAFLVMSPLAATIIDALPNYSQLSTLKIEGVSPEDHIWTKEPTSLTALDWKMASPIDDSVGPLTPANILLNAVESTCPNLKSLDITMSGNSGSGSEIPAVEPGRVQQYIETGTPTVPMMKLQHFGLEFGERFHQGSSNPEGRFLEIIERHRHTLNSVVIPLSQGPWTRGKLDFILKVCKLLPNLRALSLSRTSYRDQPEVKMTPHDFFQELTTKLASYELPIERFSVFSIDCPFSAEIGELFNEWKNLKFLHLGDLHEEEGGGFFRDDGRPHFEDYDIMEFISELPESLQELYLEVNADDVCCDEDEDFDPFCCLGPRIFSCLPRLHTCDIHAWISNIDGGLGQLPEKSVHYRRLPHKNGAELETRDTRTKDIWTSRMDSVYQGDYVKVSKDCEVAEDEDFCGEDAEEVWLDGFTSSGPSDDSWPNKDLVQAYPMYRDR